MSTFFPQNLFIKQCSLLSTLRDIALQYTVQHHWIGVASPLGGGHTWEDLQQRKGMSENIKVSIFCIRDGFKIMLDLNKHIQPSF